MVAILVFLFVVSVFLFSLRNINFRLRKDVNEVEMHTQFKLLIELLQSTQTYTKIRTETDNRSIKIIFSHAGGTTIFVLVQAMGILSIDWEEEFLKQKKYKKDWYYSEYVNQESVYLFVKESMHKYLSIIDSPKSEEKEIDHFDTHAIILSEQMTVDVGDIFCLAWHFSKKLNSFQQLSEEGAFEVLTFNCLCVLEIVKKFDAIPYDKIESGLIALLLFYLEKNELLSYIDNLNGFMDDRWKMYSIYFEKSELISKHTSCALFKLFYMFPLCNKLKMEIYTHVPESFDRTVLLMCEELASNTKLYLTKRS